MERTCTKNIGLSMNSESTSAFHYAIKGLIVTATGDLAAKFFSVITTLVILQNLVPYEYGIWRLLLSALSAFGLLGLTGVAGMFTADLSREIGHGHSRRARQLFMRFAGFFICMGVVAALALSLAAPLVSRVSGIRLTPYLWLLSTTLVITGIRRAFQAYFQAYQAPLHSQILKNVTGVTYLVGIFVWVVWEQLGVLGIVLSYVVSQALPVLLYIPYVYRTVHYTTPTEQHESVEPYNVRRALLGRGKWALAEDFASVMVSALWPWVTGYYLSISAVGLISLALLLISQVSSLVPIQYVYRSILPRMATDQRRVGEWLDRGARFTIWAHIVIGLLTLLGIWLFIPLFAPKYVPVIGLYQSLMLMLPWNAWSIVLTEWFYARQRQREMFAVNTIPGITSIIVLPLFLVTLEIAGFVVWYIATTVLSTLVIIWCIRRYDGGVISLRHVLWFDDRDVALLRSAVRRAMGKQ